MMFNKPIEMMKKIRIKKKPLLLSSLILIILIGGVIARHEYIIYINNKNYSFNIENADKNFKEDKYNEAKKYYTTALKYKDDGSIKAKLILCNVVATSLDSFNKATKLFNDKNYLDAYNAFRSVMPQDEKRYLLSQSKAKDSLKLYIDVKIASAKVFAEKSDFPNAIGQLNEIPTINGDNVKVKKLLSLYKDAQQKKLDGGETVVVESNGKQDVSNNANNTSKVSGTNTKNANKPNYVTGSDTKEDIKVDTKEDAKVVQKPVDNTTNNLIKQRYENELASLLQDLATAQSELTVRVYRNDKWNWEADQGAIRSAQKLYDSEMLDYKIWLSTI